MVANLNDVRAPRPGEPPCRLHALLPLKERQRLLDRQHVELHRAMLYSMLEKGRPLTVQEIAGMLGSEQAARHAIALLAGYDLIVRKEAALTGEQAAPDEMADAPVGAYPMTTEQTPHRIKVNGHWLYAMCAVDALAVSTVFGIEVEVDSRCHVTGLPIRLHQKGRDILDARPSSHELRVGIRWQHTSPCAAHGLCRQMVFLRNAEVARQWQSDAPLTTELYTLAEAIDCGERFFMPLLED